MSGVTVQGTPAPQPVGAAPAPATEPRAAAIPANGYEGQSQALRPGQALGYSSQAGALSPRGGTSTATVSQNLNLRASPSTGGEVLTVIPKGSTVTVLESGMWSKISFGGRVGFGFGSFIQPVTTSSTPAVTPEATPAAVPGVMPEVQRADSPVPVSTVADAAATVARAGTDAVADTTAAKDPAPTTPAPTGAAPTVAPTPVTESPASVTGAGAPATAQVTGPAPTPAAPTTTAPVAPATATAAAPVTAADTTTGAATVTTSTKQQFGPTPWIWNKWLPGNGGKASQEYKSHSRMNRAAKAKEAYPGTLAKATKVVEDATKKRDTAKKALEALQAAPGTTAKALTAAQKLVTTAQAALDKATVAFTKVQASLATIDAELVASAAEFKTWLKPQVKAKYAKRKTEWAAVEAEIDAYQPIQTYTQTTHTVTMGGQSVRLTDHTQAYSTESAGGLGGTASSDTGRKGVKDAVDATRFSADDKAAMKAISVHEGTFSTTESYDVGGVTWGFLQWTTGKDGRGSVIGVLAAIKADNPAVFKARFQDYGIDVRAGSLVVKPKGKAELVGADAVEAVRIDPILSAAFAIAGTDPAVKNAQLEVAKVKKMDHDGMDRSATLSLGTPAKKYTFKARDVFTSEWGAAVVANAGVHAGPGAVDKRLKAGLEAYFKAHPKADPANPSTWAGDAETAIAPKMIGGDQDRATAFEKDGLSKVPGSYDGKIPTPAAKKTP